MELHGHRGSNPKAALSSILNKRQKLQDELRKVEKQVYELETSYLQESGTFGNALRGFEGFLSSSNKNSNLKRSRKFQLEDGLFSLSSVTSTAAEELGLRREDGKLDHGQGRSKAGGITINGPRKPKKGKTVPRDVKKVRRGSDDLDVDEEEEEDNPHMMSFR
ncbi:unnamed protein product [Cuscuta campestris]|uniref:Chromatin modification-related protein MEAF6 n=1 Tax=Cuscuta campestris TaxID=132261 RepID=A0A484NJL9_9ASTE|nr:unnamed protein product [Cuscuta campestris]